MTALRPISPLPAPGARPARRHALAGRGPIVDRARSALRRVAAQFGEVRSTTDTDVTVRTPDGITLTLSYDPGNFVFSRVYNLTITTVLPETSAVPAGMQLSHRQRSGPEFTAAKGATASPDGIRALNAAARPHLAGIDLYSATTASQRGRRTLTVTPLGGSYVWVLIPPVFKATAFPPGEPDRILELIRAVRGLETDNPTTREKGTTP